jgi:hypothetical protein
MVNIITYWYLRSPSRFLQAFLATIQALESSLAVSDTARNMDKPLFQDYTYQGRIIGVMLRCARIFLGVFTYFLVAVAYTILFGFWLLFPALCLLSLLGSALGNSPIPTPLQ